MAQLQMRISAAVSGLTHINVYYLNIVSNPKEREFKETYKNNFFKY